MKALIKKYQDMNYFYDNEAIKQKIEERDRFVSRDQTELLELYPDDVIENAIKEATVQKMLKSLEELKNAIDTKNKAYLLERLRYDQKISIEFYNMYTKTKLPKTNKAISEIINKL